VWLIADGAGVTFNSSAHRLCRIFKILELVGVPLAPMSHFMVAMSDHQASSRSQSS
jgi:hypothetical protein